MKKDVREMQILQKCGRKNLNLINHLKKVKPNHLNLNHFNEEGSKVLGDAFLKKCLIFLIDSILTKIQD